jgi:hypothetical protein
VDCVSEEDATGEFVNLMDRMQQEKAEHDIMRSFINCILHQIL